MDIDGQGQPVTIYEMAGGEYFGYKVYRSGCWDPGTGYVDEIELLTPTPITDGAENLGAGAYQVFLDTTVTRLCHEYFVTTVGSFSAGGLAEESGPTKVQATYFYSPNQVMGQYAYGANLIVDPDILYPEQSPIAIPPGGGWELGAALPGTPVVLQWQPHPDPEVVGYRIWVFDANRMQYITNEGYSFVHLADVMGRWENTYLDYQAPCNWPLRYLDPNVWGSGVEGDWNYDSCFVLPNLTPMCSAEPSVEPMKTFGYLAEYYVEGLTAESPPATEAPLMPHGLSEMWKDAVRAVRLCDGECPNPANRCQDLGLGYACDGTVCVEGTVSELLGTPDDEGALLLADAGSISGRGLQASPDTNDMRRVLGNLEVMGEFKESAPEDHRRLGGLVMARARHGGSEQSPDRLVGQATPATSVQWLHVDHLGSTRLVTDELGKVVSRHKYLPFGEEFDNATPDEVNSHKFTGHERDAETGLDYMMARYYGAMMLFRFCSPDSLVRFDKNRIVPSRWNRYAYTLDNPLRYLDPDGRDVRVAESARHDVEEAYANSETFRDTFNAAKNNPSVNVFLQVGPTGNSDRGNAFLITTTTREGHAVTHTVTGSILTDSEQDEPQRGGNIGHELHHALVEAERGSVPEGSYEARLEEAEADILGTDIRWDYEDPTDDVSAQEASEAVGEVVADDSEAVSEEVPDENDGDQGAE